MEHAEVLERIEEAVASQGGLARLGADPSAAGVAVREHLATCAPCAAEWRAWSVVSLGLAAAAPDTIAPRPDLREQVLAAASTRPRPTPSTSPRPAVTAGTRPPVGEPSPSGPLPADQTQAASASRSGITLGPRRARTRAAIEAGTRSRPPFRLLMLGAAAMVVLFLTGIALGRVMVTTPEAPRGDPGRVLVEAASILEGGDFRMARLETPQGDAGGVVVVSPGSDRLAVVSSVLPEPPEGTRYVCLLDRSGIRTRVGYMRWEPTASGGSIAYWAGDAEPPDLGTPGDVFIVRLDAPDEPDALVGEFLG